MSASTHPQRNVLLSCLGSDREPRLAFGRVEKLMSGDSFLLCSDGLWAYLGDDEMAATVNMFPAREAAAKLVAAARERARGAGDNISVSIIKLLDTQADRPV